LQRRAFLRLLALAGAAGASLDPRLSQAQAAGELYDVPPFGNVSLLHVTDTHAQLLPTYFREPSVNIGLAGALGRPPHLAGKAFLEFYNLKGKSQETYAFSSVGFEAAARRYGKVGGFAHLATLVKRLRAGRPHALLLDGGDSWQGSASSLWTRGADMIAAQKQLGVELTTGHWEFTYGAERVMQAVRKELGPIEFLAQNVRTTDFEEPVFEPYVLRSVNGVALAVIGQAFPYTPIANPRRFMPDWTFGIQEKRLQQMVDEVRGKGAQAVVLLSHNGMDVDLKLAARVRGIDAILGGHTHDGVPRPVVVGRTLVTNAGCNGKFLAVLDLDVKAGGVAGYRYRLLPVFSHLLAEDAEMKALVESVRRPYKEKLEEKLAVTEGLLYRRGNFNGTWDQLIVDALMEVHGADIAFSPGFRWGTTLLPGEPILREHLMDQTAITYPQATLTGMTGAQIKAALEDICDNLFNPDPYLQQGGDMVRTGGLTYACRPNERISARIADPRVKGVPLDAAKTYQVAGWASVADDPQGEPIWDLVERWLKDRKSVSPRKLNSPKLVGVAGNPGLDE
jgi:sulfur-oxidizing protein SoxB